MKKSNRKRDQVMGTNERVVGEGQGFRPSTSGPRGEKKYREGKESCVQCVAVGGGGMPFMVEPLQETLIGAANLDLLKHL
jgi:hypothetical protein